MWTVGLSDAVVTTTWLCSGTKKPPIAVRTPSPWKTPLSPMSTLFVVSLSQLMLPGPHAGRLAMSSHGPTTGT